MDLIFEGVVTMLLADFNRKISNSNDYNFKWKNSLFIFCEC